MDPLIAARYHNLTFSPLCQLPEEFLLDIMKRLDLISIECIRRASRLFLRLYSFPEFSHTYNSQRWPLSYRHWFEPKDEAYGKESFKQLSNLLNRDITNYCGDCRRRRTAARISAMTTVYLHCSGCNTDHPRCLFSRAQRSVGPKSRICIRREGFIRVCDHQTTTWKEVIQTALRLAELDTSKALVVLGECMHKSHFPSHHHTDTSTRRHQTIHPIIQI